MKLQIFSLNWNGIHYLRELRKNIGPNAVKISSDVIWSIRDNGSRDGSIQEMKDWKIPGVSLQLFDIGHNRDNFAKGMNFLFNENDSADDDIILLLNNDVTFPTDDVLSKMYGLMQRTNAGVVGVRLLYPNSNKIQHGGVIFSHKKNDLAWHYRVGEKSDTMAEKNRYFQVVTGALCLIKASSFRRVGGFCEDYFWSFEDVDLNLLIGQKEKIAYCGETFAYHVESASLRKNNLNKLFVNSNVDLFKSRWSGKYEIDHEKYLNDPTYKIIPS